MNISITYRSEKIFLVDLWTATSLREILIFDAQSACVTEFDIEFVFLKFDTGYMNPSNLEVSLTFFSFHFLFPSKSM